MTLIRVYQNPWEHTVPDDDLVTHLAVIASLRGEHLTQEYEAGHYSRDSLGLAFLNPAAPQWQPSSETLLATIALGPEGERFIPNAIAKAVEHRDHGQLAGFGAYVDLAQSVDGDFCYGYSASVDGFIAGASGLSELQDAREAGLAATELLYRIRETRNRWRNSHQDNRWFRNLDQPRELYTQMANQPAPIYDTDAS